MNPDISDFVLDELRFVLKKMGQVVELLRYFVRQESHPVYASLFEAVAAVRSAEAEVSQLRRSNAPERSPDGHVSYRIVPEEKVVYLTVVGGAPFGSFVDALQFTLADPAYRSGFDFICDRTRYTALPEMSDVRQAADFFKHHAGVMGQFRWAMVSRNPVLQRMQGMFAVLSETWGTRSEVFKDIDDARRWLMADEAETKGL